MNGTKMITTARPRERREALNETLVWQVFARRKYEEPLHEIGNVMADDVGVEHTVTVDIFALSIYDEFSWIEMVLVPRVSMVTVITS